MEIDISDMRSYNETLQKCVRINLGHPPKLMFQIRSGRRTFQRNHPTLPDIRLRELDCNYRIAK
jgi:hypothetical protein